MDDTFLESFSNKKYTLELHHDDSGIADPMWDDNHLIIATFSRKYSLGNHGEIKSEDYTCIEDRYKALIRSLGGRKAILYESPLYLYDHSGITISLSPFNCSWDSGQVGYVFITRKSYKAIQGVKRITKKMRESLPEIAKSEIETYDNYLQGNVYGYRLYENKTCECCGNAEREEIDSCWGFITSNLCEFKEGLPGILSLDNKEIEDLLKGEISESISR